jgi:hypothetical protein
MIRNQKIKSAAALCCLMAISAMTPASAATAVSALQQLPTTLLTNVNGAVEIHAEASTGSKGYNLTGAFGGAAGALLTNSAGDGGVFAVDASAADAIAIPLTVAASAQLFLYVPDNATAYNATGVNATISNLGTVIVGALPATEAVPA